MNSRYIYTLFVLVFTLTITPNFVSAQWNDTSKVEVLPDTISIAIPQKKVEKIEKVKMSDSTKIMLAYVKKADKYFYGDNKRFDLAIEAYFEAQKFGNNDQKVVYNIGYSYFAMKNYSAAKLYFEEITGKDSISEKKAIYYLAKISHLQYDFDKSLEYYNQYYKLLNPIELSNERKDIERMKKQCVDAKELYANPVNTFIDKLSDSINSNYVDYAPIASRSGKLLIFTSRRPIGDAPERDYMGRFYEKIYSTRKDNKGNWSKAKLLGKSINKSDHNAAAGLSADGKKLIVYRNSNNGDLYESTYSAGIWQSAKSLGKNVNTSAHEASASFSYDRVKIYFSSDREGGFGGHDLYQSNLDENEKWGMAENLKAKVNSAYDEISMVAMPDGKTFYFTSNGHNTMGGYDIFKITYKDSVWGEPTNLGYPINTPDDDVLYSVSSDGKKAYIASSRTDTSMHDIYLITFATQIKNINDQLDGNLLVVNEKGAALPELDNVMNIKKMNLTVLKGSINDEFTNDPLFANIELTDNATNTVVATFNSNEQTGQYLVSLPSGKDYGISVKSENCLFHSENLTIGNGRGYNEIIKNIKLKRIEVGSKVELKNLFFASGKAELTKSSETELNNLLTLLNEIPSLKLEIAGHTDAVGKATNNQKLSGLRASAVVDYLLEKGISADRLVAKGYGEEKPVADNKTKEGRSKNRRIEFEVIAR